ncbi:pseudouridine synthase [Spongiibacter sp. KMU-166]|uniref:Pseudouridine synthase n=1 Tax=Spongiibacter thalassae TaxID=2721624 RepID=A0ABX1GID3_9GAMM|nr:pseudouridine synthase [Spongiibacter thalassae]NKI18263.1 pseudouridine synthase [Spongiibacter thalassae]
MTFATTRLDRFIARNTAFNKSTVRLLLAQRRVVVNGQFANSIQQQVTPFTHVEVDGLCLNNHTPLYIMLNKPKGVVCATRDDRHTTVVDLLDHPRRDELHIVGRLDFNTTGLVLLTNDGNWSRRISLPQTKLPKTYEVVLSKPVTADYISVFQQGIYFAYEGIHTQPARLEITGEFSARLTLTEGKYHQVKRMFGYFQNEVLSLHRVSVGDFTLDDLAAGESRELLIAPAG